jgi:hypothetical protein
MDRAQVNLVQVTPDNRIRRVWMVAAPRDETISVLLNAVPEGWADKLLPLRSVQASWLKMQPGDIRELVLAPFDPPFG